MATGSNTDTTNPYYTYSWKPTESTLNAHAARDANKDCQYMLPTLWQVAGTKPDLTLLDVGCGAGSITVSLASCIPEGKVVGVDYSETSLERAKQLAKDKNAENVTFQVANAYSLPFDDESFDVVHTHQTVAHLKEHVKAIVELKRVCKKGGFITMREADLYSARIWPPSVVLEEAWQSFIKLHEVQGLDCDCGRQLKSWTKQAGIPEENITMTAGTFCYSTTDERQAFNPARLWEGPPAAKALEMGVASADRIKDYVEAWKKWLSEEDGLIMLMHGQIVARV